MNLVPILGNEPSWLLKEKELRELWRGALVIDCPYMALISRGSDATPRVYEGSGVIIQNPEGPGFVCRLQLGRGLSPEEVLAGISVLAGSVVPDHLIYDLKARDWRSQEWSAEYLAIDPSSGQVGATIVAKIPFLKVRSEQSRLKTWNSASLLYWGDITFPFTDWTEYKLKLLDGCELPSGARDSVKLTLGDIAARIHRYVDYARVDITSDSPISPEVVADFNDSLRFILARNVDWSVMHHVAGSEIVMHVRGRLDPPRKSRRGAPLHYSSAGPPYSGLRAKKMLETLNSSIWVEYAYSQTYE